MAYDGYMKFNDVEIINVARTAKVARALGLSTIRIKSELIDAISHRFVNPGLADFDSSASVNNPADPLNSVMLAPWFDPRTPASSEFAGLVPLNVAGLRDSSYTASPVEFTGNGGNISRGRNSTQALVFSVALVATTDRGAEYGKRWLSNLLSTSSNRTFCSGADLEYLRSRPNEEGDGGDLVHRRDVSLTRGISITRTKVSKCSVTWLATFTMTAGDPFVYGSPQVVIPMLGINSGASGPLVEDYEVTDLFQESCPVYDYSPIYDPLYPALVPSPTAPNFLPDGWTITEDRPFTRASVLVQGELPDSYLPKVPLIKIRSAVAARMVRVSIFSGPVGSSEQCGSMFSAVISYLPANQDFYIDAEQKASYVWNGFAPNVRRTDSLVYSPVGNPVEWGDIITGYGLTVTLDAFARLPGTGSGIEGDGAVEMSLRLISKSD